jgi:5-methylcytosine-specific restriction endonuclease McrA
MNRQRLTQAIDRFDKFYSEDVPKYKREERDWKDALSIEFKNVFSSEDLDPQSFVTSLKRIFSDKKFAHDIIWLAGGAFYQHRRFLDLLESDVDQARLQALFYDLLLSKGRVRDRINNFKDAIDKIYKERNFRETIQLNLISQFLGFVFPDVHFIYKSTELQQAGWCFEYTVQPFDHSAGSVYEHYWGLAKEVKSAMNEAGLINVDYIDVQTFIFLTELYLPADYDKEIGEYEKSEEKAQSLSTKKLIELIAKAKPKPPKPVLSEYYNRNPNIAALVKQDSRGNCNLCNSNAPFITPAGNPYLESHHIINLASGGKDVVTNCVALCPNCHRKMDILNLDEDRQQLLRVAHERYQRLFRV